MSARTADNLAHMASLPQGWHRLYLALLDALPEGYEVDLAKEKFGAMRVYGRGGRVSWALLDHYAALSRKTCELCGEAGRISVKDGWYKALCSWHAKDHGFEIPPPRAPSETGDLAPDQTIEPAGDMERLQESSRPPAKTPAPPLRGERPSLRVLDPAAVPSASDERVAEWVKTLSKPLPLEGAAAMSSTQDGGIMIARQLGARAPWLSQLADIVERNTRLQLTLGKPWLRLDPLLLVGPAGAGKSHWARMLAQIAACGHGAIDLGGSSDTKGLDATHRGWGNAYPSWPAVMIARSGCANPILVIEEVEKAGGSDRNGRAHDTLLAMLEPSSARAYPDACFQAGVDLSQVSWVATANSIEGLPRPLLSRFHIVQVAGPGPEHADVIAEVIAGQLALEWGIPADTLPALPRRVRRALVEVLGQHRSTRAAKRLLTAAFSAMLRDRPRSRWLS